MYGQLEKLTERLLAKLHPSNDMNSPVARTVEKMKMVCKNPFILCPSLTPNSIKESSKKTQQKWSARPLHKHWHESYWTSFKLQLLIGWMMPVRALGAFPWSPIKDKQDAGEILKRSFISMVRPTVHTNPTRKRSFSKTSFKPEEFENAGLSL